MLWQSRGLIPVLILAAGFACCFTGCTLGPRQITAGRMKYNESIQRTFQEEILLNLVRLKYRESPEFLTIGGVAAQYSFDTAAAIGGDINELSPDSLGVNGLFSRSETPTITYAPHRDEAFSRGLLSPISIESLALFTRTGWRADRIMRLAVQEINLVDNATSAGGPTPDVKPDFEEFKYLTEVIRQLQVQKHIELAQAERERRKEIPLPIEQLDGDFAMAAVREGYEIHTEPESGKVYLTKDQQFAAIILHPHGLDTPFAHELRRLLDLDPECTVYEVNTATEGQIQPAFHDLVSSSCVNGARHLPPTTASRDKITISTRSIMEMMFYLSHAIEVPPEHYEKGLVTVTVDESGQPFDWNEMTGDLLRVQVCKHRPRCASVAIPYMGYWYYIDDRDLNSQTTFQLLIEMFSVEVRGGGGDRLPVLTLGVGR